MQLRHRSRHVARIAPVVLASAIMMALSGFAGAADLLVDPAFDGPATWKQEVWQLEDKVTMAGTVSFVEEAGDKFLRLARTVDNGNMFTIQTSQRVAFVPGSTYQVKLTARSPQSVWVAILAQKDDGYYEAVSDVQYKPLTTAFSTVEADLKIYDSVSGPLRLSICLASGPAGTSADLDSIELTVR
jgi:hypothetical protein